MRALLVAVILGALLPQPDRGEPLELLVCGWDEVYALRFHSGTDSTPQRIWTWRGKDRADLPDDFKKLFDHTDECKPFDGGSRILITSSDGAAALVDRDADRVVFYARAPNAHSADLLPGGRVAVAASHHAKLKGDRLIVFDLTKPDQELWSEELPSGHGVVWDDARQVLWALADKDIRVFELREWKTAVPRLHRVAVIPLPEGGGHDFSAAGSTLIAVSTTSHGWLFDRETRTLRPHPDLADVARVKAISHHPKTGRIAYVQAEGKNWWAERIHFLRPEGTLHVPGEHFYKVRWSVPRRP